MKAVIFNSGTGNRMGKLTENNHKSMVSLKNGETIFERQIRILSECGIKDFVVTTGPFEAQLKDVAKQKRFKNLKFTFVKNPIYDKTNYIYSMYLARKYMEEDILLLHGDLVFNKKLITDILKEKKSSLALIDKSKALPSKDFKARIKNDYLQEVAIDIFDEDCYAFQPLYKLEKKNAIKWLNKVSEFIEIGNDKVYAENALNQILSKMNLKTFSYQNYYIDEVDTAEDLERVSNEIRKFDFEEQEIYTGQNLETQIKKILEENKVEKPFIVHSKSLKNHKIINYLKSVFKDLVLFNDFAPNPLYEDVVKGTNTFKSNNCDFIISLGGGSAIDVAKAIKLFSVLDEKTNYLKQDYKYSRVKHLSIPSTSGTGSESTIFSVIYYKGEKQSVMHDSILPEYVVLDYTLLRSVPDYHKKSTMLDALCQAIESFWSVNSSDLSQEKSKKSIKLILNNIDSYLENKDSGLQNVLKAANYSGQAINLTQTTAAHAMSYKITSLYNVAHGQAVALVLPYIWEYMVNNIDKSIDARGTIYLRQMFDELNKLFNSDKDSDTINKFIDIYKSFNLNEPSFKSKTELKELVESVNETRLANNPVSLSKAAILDIYTKALTKE